MHLSLREVEGASERGLLWVEFQSMWSEPLLCCSVPSPLLCSALLDRELTAVPSRSLQRSMDDLASSVALSMRRERVRAWLPCCRRVAAVRRLRPFVLFGGARWMIRLRFDEARGEREGDGMGVTSGVQRSGRAATLASSSRVYFSRPPLALAGRKRVEWHPLMVASDIALL